MSAVIPFDISSLTPNTTYTFTVTPVGLNGHNGRPNSFTITSPAVIYTASLQNNNNQSVTISISGVYQYINIQRDGINIQSRYTGYSYQDTSGLIGDASYVYQITPYNKANQPAPSFIIQTLTPPIISNLGYVSDISSITLSISGTYSYVSIFENTTQRQIKITHYDISYLPHYDISYIPHYDNCYNIVYDIVSSPHYDVSYIPHYDISYIPHYDISYIPHYDISYIPHYDISYIPHYDISYIPEYDVNGNPVLDNNGDPVVDISMIPAYDISGNPVLDVSMIPAYDINGNPVLDVSMIPAYDISGNPVLDISFIPAYDTNGDPVLDMSMIPAYDTNGDPVLDMSMIPAYDVNGDPIYDTSTVIRRDNSGNIVYDLTYVLKYDDSGNIVYDISYILLYDNLGNIVYDVSLIPYYDNYLYDTSYTDVGTLTIDTGYSYTITPYNRDNIAGASSTIAAGTLPIIYDISYYNNASSATFTISGNYSYVSATRNGKFAGTTNNVNFVDNSGGMGLWSNYNYSYVFTPINNELNIGLSGSSFPPITLTTLPNINKVTTVSDVSSIKLFIDGSYSFVSIKNGSDTIATNLNDSSFTDTNAGLGLLPDSSYVYMIIPFNSLNLPGNPVYTPLVYTSPILYSLSNTNDSHSVTININGSYYYVNIIRNNVLIANHIYGNTYTDLSGQLSNTGVGLNSNTVYNYSVIPYGYNDVSGNTLSFVIDTYPELYTVTNTNNVNNIVLNISGSYSYVDILNIDTNTLVVDHVYDISYQINQLSPNTTYNYSVIPYNANDISGIVFNISNLLTQSTIYAANYTSDISSVSITVSGVYAYFDVIRDGVVTQTNITGNSYTDVSGGAGLMADTSMNYIIIPFNNNNLAGAVFPFTIDTLAVVYQISFPTYSSYFVNLSISGYYETIDIYRNGSLLSHNYSSQLYTDTSGLIPNQSYTYTAIPYNSNAIRGSLSTPATIVTKPLITTTSNTFTTNSVTFNISGGYDHITTFRNGLAYSSISGNTFTDVSCQPNIVYSYEFTPYNSVGVYGNVYNTSVITVPQMYALDYDSTTNSVTLQISGAYSYVDISRNYRSHTRKVMDISFTDRYQLIPDTSYVYSFTPFNTNNVAGTSFDIVAQTRPLLYQVNYSTVTSSAVSLSISGVYNYVNISRNGTDIASQIYDVSYTDNDVALTTDISYIYTVTPYNLAALNGNSITTSNTSLIPYVNFTGYSNITGSSLKINFAGSYNYVRVSRNTAGSLGYLNILTRKDVSYNDYTLTPNTLYNYYIIAYNWLDVSNGVIVVTPNISPIASVSFSGYNNITYNSVTVNFSSVNTFLYVSIARITNGVVGTYTDLSNGVTSYTDTNLSSANIYSYSIVPKNAIQLGGAPITTGNVVINSNVSFVSYTNNTGTTMTVNFTGSYSYVKITRNSNGRQGINYIQSNVGDTSFNDTLLTPLGIYTYSIIPYNVYDISGATITTPYTSQTANVALYGNAVATSATSVSIPFSGNFYNLSIFNQYLMKYNITSSPYVFTGLLPDMSYTFSLIPYNSNYTAGPIVNTTLYTWGNVNNIAPTVTGNSVAVGISGNFYYVGWKNVTTGTSGTSYINGSTDLSSIITDVSTNIVYDISYIPHYDISSNIRYDISYIIPHYDISYIPQYDANGNPVYDACGNTIYSMSMIPLYDACGNTVYDASMIPHLDASGRIVYDVSMILRRDVYGNIVYDVSSIPRRDGSGNIVYRTTVIGQRRIIRINFTDTSGIKANTPYNYAITPYNESSIPATGAGIFNQIVYSGATINTSYTSSVTANSVTLTLSGVFSFVNWTNNITNISGSSTFGTNYFTDVSNIQPDISYNYTITPCNGNSVPNSNAAIIIGNIYTWGNVTSIYPNLMGNLVLPNGNTIVVGNTVTYGTNTFNAGTYVVISVSGTFEKLKWINTITGTTQTLSGGINKIIDTSGIAQNTYYKYQLIPYNIQNTPATGSGIYVANIFTARSVYTETPSYLFYNALVLNVTGYFNYITWINNVTGANGNAYAIGNNAVLGSVYIQNNNFANGTLNTYISSVPSWTNTGSGLFLIGNGLWNFATSAGISNYLVVQYPANLAFSQNISVLSQTNYIITFYAAVRPIYYGQNIVFTVSINGVTYYTRTFLASETNWQYYASSAFTFPTSGTYPLILNFNAIGPVTLDNAMGIANFNIVYVSDDYAKQNLNINLNYNSLQFYDISLTPHTAYTYTIVPYDYLGTAYMAYYTAPNYTLYFYTSITLDISGTGTYAVYYVHSDSGYGYNIYVFTAGTNKINYNILGNTANFYVLCVGGGGGGGATSGLNGGAGGGGGGGVTFSQITVPGGIDTVTTTVGTGGSGATTQISGPVIAQGTNGGNSTFSFTQNTNLNITAIGGGAGGIVKPIPVSPYLFCYYNFDQSTTLNSNYELITKNYINGGGSGITSATSGTLSISQNTSISGTNSLYFSGGQSFYVNFTIPSGSPGFSFQIWFYATTAAGANSPRIIQSSLGDGMSIYHGGGSTTISGAFSAIYTVGAWQHLVCVYNFSSNTAQYYLNNVQYSGGFGYAAGNSYSLSLGNKAGGSADPFVGYYDDFQLYNIALTSNNVSYLYNNPGSIYGVSAGGGSGTYTGSTSGLSGGSGGGGTNGSVGGSGTSGQGNSGGSGVINGAGGSGGGAGGSGTNATSVNGTQGGIGNFCNLDGIRHLFPYYWGGGGGSGQGSTYALTGFGGLGGGGSGAFGLSSYTSAGGNWSLNYGSNGRGYDGNGTYFGGNGGDNTGGGGGGGSCTQVSYASSGGNGGSGIIILAIPTNTITPVVTSPTFNIASSTANYTGSSNGYVIHTFTQNGTFSFNNAQNAVIYILAVGGGGSGTLYNGIGGGGGGGGGGMVERAILVNGSDTINISIGNGGGSGPFSTPSSGGSTYVSFNTNSQQNIVAYGGGGAGSAQYGGSGSQGQTGGCGGGAQGDYTVVGFLSSPGFQGGGCPIAPITTNASNPGGSSYGGSGGGGGGAGGNSVWNNTSNGYGNQGGPGKLCVLPGISTYYNNVYWAGGGGGGSANSQNQGGWCNGGIGGGGGAWSGTGSTSSGGGNTWNGVAGSNSTTSQGGNGAPNTGGGGGGGGALTNGVGYSGGYGGSGIVVIAIYTSSTPDIAAVTTPPAVPPANLISSVNVSSSALNASAITLSFSGNYNTLTLYDNSQNPQNTQLFSGVTGSSYTVAGLSPNTPYSFTVIPYDPYGVAGTPTVSSTSYTLPAVFIGPASIVGGALSFSILNANSGAYSYVNITISSYNVQPGWVWYSYNSYHSENPNIDTTASLINGVLGVSTGTITDFTNLNSATNNNWLANQSQHNFTIIWKGLLYTQSYSGTWNFQTNSDDGSYMWIGSTALSGYLRSNALVDNGDGHGMRTISANISLNAYTYYPVRIMFGEGGGGYDMQFRFTPPGLSQTANGTGFFYTQNSPASLSTVTNITASSYNYTNIVPNTGYSFIVTPYNAINVAGSAVATPAVYTAPTVFNAGTPSVVSLTSILVPYTGRFNSLTISNGSTSVTGISGLSGTYLTYNIKGFTNLFKTTNGYYVYVFTQSVANAIDISGSGNMYILAVGGGGSGGTNASGGGGGGGVIQQTVAITQREVISINIGAGGQPSINKGNNGGKTSLIFSPDSTYNLTAIGGGAGGSGTYAAGSGGSGGGAGGYSNVAGIAVPNILAGSSATATNPNFGTTFSNCKLYFPFDTNVLNYASGTGVSVGSIVGSACQVSSSFFNIGSGSLMSANSTSGSSYFSITTTIPANVNGYSFAFWVYITATNAGMVWSFSQSSNNGNRIYCFYTSSNLYISIGSNVQILTPTLNNWYHIGWTLTTGSYSTVYVNGVVVLTTSSVAYVSYAFNKNYILSDPYGSSNPGIYGYIDDFYYFDTILSAANIDSIYTGSYSTTTLALGGNNGGTGNGGGGGGGGGASAAGGSPSGTVSGNGGNGIVCTLPGISSSIYGSYYWGGGGGGSYSTGTSGGNGGLGGGGGAANYSGTVGVGGGSSLNPGQTAVATGVAKAGGAGGANTGGGGGGASLNSGYANGGAGGSGIVIIALPPPSLYYIYSNALAPNTSYTFSLTPYNVIGVAGNTVTLPSVYTLGQITNCTLISYYPTSILLNFTGSYSNVTISNSLTSYSGITGTQYQYTNLIANKLYTFSILPYNVSNISGTPFITASIYTLPIITNITVIPSSTTGLMITFTGSYANTSISITSSSSYNTLINNYVPVLGQSTSTAISGAANAGQNGTYNISSSYNDFGSQYNNYQAFAYSSSNTNYWGCNSHGSTTVVGGITISGEWLQIQIPYRLSMTSFTTCSVYNSPNSIHIAGSNNGSTWYTISNITTTGLTNTNSATVFGSPVVYTTNTNANFYTYFRFIVTSPGGQTNLGKVNFSGLVSTNSTVYSGIISSPYYINGLTVNSSYYCTVTPYNSNSLAGNTVASSITYTQPNISTVGVPYATSAYSVSVPFTGNYSTVSIFNGLDATVYGITTSPYSFTGLLANTQYNFTVTPYNANNNAGASANTLSIFTWGNVYIQSAYATSTSSVLINYSGKYQYVSITNNAGNTYAQVYTASPFIYPKLNANTPYTFSFIPYNNYGVAGNVITTPVVYTLPTVQFDSFTPVSANIVNINFSKAFNTVSITGSSTYNGNAFLSGNTFTGISASPYAFGGLLPNVPYTFTITPYNAQNISGGSVTTTTYTTPTFMLGNVVANSSTSISIPFSGIYDTVTIDNSTSIVNTGITNSPYIFAGLTQNTLYNFNVTPISSGISGNTLPIRSICTWGEITNTSVQTVAGTSNISISFTGTYTSVSIANNQGNVYTGITSSPFLYPNLDGSSNYTFTLTPYNQSNVAGVSVNTTPLYSNSTVTAYITNIYDNAVLFTFYGYYSSISIANTTTGNTVTGITSSPYLFNGLTVNSFYDFTLTGYNGTGTVGNTFTYSVSTTVYGKIYNAAAVSSSAVNIYFAGVESSVGISTTQLSVSGSPVVSGITTSPYTYSGLSSNIGYTFYVYPYNSLGMWSSENYTQTATVYTWASVTGVTFSASGSVLVIIATITGRFTGIYWRNLVTGTTSGYIAGANTVVIQDTSGVTYSNYYNYNIIPVNSVGYSPAYFGSPGTYTTNYAYLTNNTIGFNTLVQMTPIPNGSGGTINIDATYTSRTNTSATATVANTATGYTYANGTYTMTTSGAFGGGYYSYYPFNNYNNNGDPSWSSSNNWSGGVNNNYSSTTNLGTVNGVWLQIQLPYATYLASYALRTRGQSDPSSVPKAFYVTGSNDGTTWTVIDNQTNATQTSSTTTYSGFTTPITKYYYYRLIIYQNYGTSYSSVIRFDLNGYLNNVVGNTLTTTNTPSFQTSSFIGAKVVDPSRNAIGIDYTGFCTSISVYNNNTGTTISNLTANPFYVTSLVPSTAYTLTIVPYYFTTIVNGAVFNINATTTSAFSLGDLSDASNGNLYLPFFGVYTTVTISLGPANVISGITSSPYIIKALLPTTPYTVSVTPYVAGVAGNTITKSPVYPTRFINDITANNYTSTTSTITLSYTGIFSTVSIVAGNAAPVTDITATTYTFSSLLSGTSYLFQLTPYDASGNSGNTVNMNASTLPTITYGNVIATSSTTISLSYGGNNTYLGQSYEILDVSSYYDTNIPFVVGLSGSPYVFNKIYTNSSTGVVSTLLTPNTNYTSFYLYPYNNVGTINKNSYINVPSAYTWGKISGVYYLPTLSTVTLYVTGLFSAVAWQNTTTGVIGNTIVATNNAIITDISYLTPFNYYNYNLIPYNVTGFGPLTFGSTGTYTLANVIIKYGYLNLITLTAAQSCQGAYACFLVNNNYTGPVIQLRNFSDATGSSVSDFYSDICGNMTTGPNGTGIVLNQWLADPRYAFVSKWYDQSVVTTNHATQSNVNLQPVFDVSWGLVNFGYVGSGGGFTGVANSQAYFNLPNGALPYNDSSYTYVTKIWNLSPPSTVGGIVSGGSNGGSNMTIIYVTNANIVTNGWYGNDLNSTVNFTPNSIISATYVSGSTKTIIVNGNITSQTVSNRAQNNTLNYIGQYAGGGGCGFNGQMYYLYVFSTALDTYSRGIIESTVHY